MRFAGSAPRRSARLSSNVRPRKPPPCNLQRMKPVPSLAIRYQLVNAAIALGCALLQWLKNGWRPALFLLVWVFVVLSLPLAFYFAKSTVSAWWRRRKL